MVAHHSVGQKIYGENPGQDYQTILYPLPAVIKVLAGVAIISAEKCAADTAGRAMVIRGMVETDLLASGDCHVDSVIESVVTITTDWNPFGTRTNYALSPDLIYLMGVPVLSPSSVPVLAPCPLATNFIIKNGAPGEVRTSDPLSRYIVVNLPDGLKKHSVRR